MIKELISFFSLGINISGTLFLPENDSKVPAVIMCHGAGDYKEDYFPLAAYLSEHGFAVLCIDMHGHGESGGERYNVRMSEWTSDIYGALDFLLTHPRIISDKIGAFGISSGGTAILEAAVVDKRLRSLVVLDSTVRDSLPFFQSLSFRVLSLLGSVNKFFTGSDWRVSLQKFGGGMQLAADSKLNAEIISNPRFKEAYENFPFPGAKESFIVDTIKRVGKIKSPTMVIWGEKDMIDPPETAKILYDALTCEKEIHVIKGNGHVGHLDIHKDEVYALTLQWFEKLKL
ncbi:MAG: alpha/beta fold hydrolase [Candidatus Paceibacterota bacterium]|jgi:pimeloyl-ACP methyl ester carboxylesterase